MKHETQKQKVLKELRTNGFVTRNWALKSYISRLGAIILKLKKDGCNIEAEYMENGDYKYVLKDVPKITEYRVNGALVAKKIEWN